MKQLVTVNLTTRTADWQPPVLTFGESLTLALRFTKTIAGNDVEPNLAIASAKASIGRVDERPGGGKFALAFTNDPPSADNTTDELSHDCTPQQLAAAINAKATVTGLYGNATVKKVDGSWLLRFGTGAAQVPFQVVENTLWPISFGVITAREIDNAWVHELRLSQAPVAFTGGEPDLRLPSLPSCSVKIHGGASSDQVWDTVQQLYIPPDFRGTYRLVKDHQRTGLISETDGADTIQAALITAFGDTFTVTLPFSYRFYLDLGGKFAGTDVPALDVEGGDAPAQDLYITLPLDRLELASMLRALPSVTLPLEIRLVCSEDGGPAEEIVALYTPVTIQRPLALPILDELQTIDWLRFPSPKTYIVPGAGNILTGEKIDVFIVGNGALTVFVLPHVFATREVQVFARLAADGGRQLVDGTDFTATVDSDAQVTVTALTGAPALNAWRITIVAAVLKASWQEDLTVNQDQVNGLEDRLDAIEANISELQALLPGTASLPTGLAPANGFTIQFPVASEILFARDANGLPITDVTKLPARAPYLLPAISRVDNNGALPDPLPDPVAGNLYTTAAATLIPGGAHVRSSMSTAGGFVGSDGRILYPMTRSGTKDSYFPTPFERTLFEVAINDIMFSSGTVLTCLFKLALQLLGSNTEAQWVLAIEHAPITDETHGDPNTFDSNLYTVDWATATPLLLQRLVVTSALETHGFGVTIARTGEETFTAAALKYKRAFTATANAPATANFALRGRLFNFDTKNSVTDARGWVSWALQAPDNGNLGIVIA